MVVPGDLYEVTDTEWQDIVEESAYLAEDFGGYFVERWYQLDRYVTADAESRLEYCGQNSRCYVDELFASGLDYVLVVSVFFNAPDFAIRFQTIDLATGAIVADEGAVLPSAQAFEYLVAPCHEALKVTPEWTTLARPAPLVEPAPMETIRVVPSPEPERSSFATAGTVSAGLGAAFLTGGVLLAFAADETQQTIQSEPHERRELESLQARGQRQVRTANALMGIGGAALVGGAALLILDHLDNDDEEPVFSIGVSPVGVGIRARF